ncbi:hypothetical protein SLE2022_096750 [Rubroshorea leprosula]
MSLRSTVIFRRGAKQRQSRRCAPITSLFYEFALLALVKFSYHISEGFWAAFVLITHNLGLWSKQSSILDHNLWALMDYENDTSESMFQELY